MVTRKTRSRGAAWIAAAISGTAVLAVACTLLSAQIGHARAMHLQSLSKYPRATLTITGRTHTARFRVWVANTWPREVQGLMFVRQLSAHAGMLFPVNPPRVATFWMKDTYIPLDMVFIGAGGRIRKIAANAVPFSLAVVRSNGPVHAVLEIPGGDAHRFGLHVGDVVSER